MARKISPMNKTPLIALNNVSFGYGEKAVIEQVSLTIHRGEIVTLIGPNGAGKSTLLKLVMGLLKPHTGTIRRHPALKLGYMPQKLYIDASFPLTVKRFLTLGQPSSGLDEFWLKKTGVDKLLDDDLRSLSGGQLQRAMLCRAIFRKPDLLVLDEPLQGVDVQGQAYLYRLLKTVRDQLNCAILLVSHDLHLVMAQTDQVICLNHHVCCSGTPQRVKDHPEYQKLFGIQDDIFAIYTHHHQACDHHNHD